jgi:hypothetical protein
MLSPWPAPLQPRRTVHLSFILLLIGTVLSCGPILAETPPLSPSLPLPDQSAMPPGLDDSPNPLLDFSKTEAARRSKQQEEAEGTLQSLSPFMPGEIPPADLLPPQPTDRLLTPQQQALVALAEKVASSVVSIRIWDQYGGLLASGVGSFVSSDGLILTDASLLHPEFADRIDYITTTAANGTNHRVTGFYVADLRTGVALLQGDGLAPQALELKPETDFSKPQSCRVVALSDKRGLLIADAKVSLDETLAGQGWLTLRGEDSPGGVGSPVLSEQGDIIGIVAMKTPIDSWMNFALPAEWAAFEVQKKRPFLKSLKELPRGLRFQNSVPANPDPCHGPSHPKAPRTDQTISQERRMLGSSRPEYEFYGRHSGCFDLPASSRGLGPSVGPSLASNGYGSTTLPNRDWRESCPRFRGRI